MRLRQVEAGASSKTIGILEMEDLPTWRKFCKPDVKRIGDIFLHQYFPRKLSIPQAGVDERPSSIFF
jgi:hypothetical protein